MRLARSLLLVIALVAAGVTAFAAVGISAQDRTPAADRNPNNPPPLPPWVNEDGSIDESKVPECTPVYGDGRASRDGEWERGMRAQGGDDRRSTEVARFRGYPRGDKGG